MKTPFWSKGSTILFFTTWVWFVYFTTRMILSPLFPIFRDEFSLSYIELGLIQTSFISAYAIMQLPSGLFADRVGKVRVIMIGLLVSAIATFATGMVQSHTQLLVCQFILGIGEGTLFAPSMTILAEHFPKRKRGQAVSIYGVGASAGSISAPLLTGLFAEMIGWRVIYSTFAALIGIVFIIFLKLPKDTTTAPPQKDPSSSNTNIKKVLSIPVIILTTVYTLNAFGLGPIRTFLPSFLVDEFGMGLTLANLLFTILPIMGLISMYSGGYFSDKFGRRPIMIVALVITIFIAIAIPLAPTLPILVVIFILYGFISGMPAMVIYAFFGDVTDPKIRSTAYGFMNLVGMGGQAIAPIVAGHLIDLVGFHTTFIILPPIALGIGIILLLTLKEDRETELAS